MLMLQASAALLRRHLPFVVGGIFSTMQNKNRNKKKERYESARKINAGTDAVVGR